MIYISIVHLETSTWKKQEAPQYGDSHLTDLVKVKPVTKDISIDADEAGDRNVQQRPSPSLSSSMEVYFRKRDLNTCQSNS